jgi:hypothetical protein
MHSDRILNIVYLENEIDRLTTERDMAQSAIDEFFNINPESWTEEIATCRQFVHSLDLEISQLRAKLAIAQGE